MAGFRGFYDFPCRIFSFFYINCCRTTGMIKDSLFQNEIFFQSSFFVLFLQENPGGQNCPANGAILATSAINLTKGNEKPNIMLGFSFLHENHI